MNAAQKVKMTIKNRDGKVVHSVEYKLKSKRTEKVEGIEGVESVEIREYTFA